MNEMGKLYRVLKLITILVSTDVGRTVAEIAERLQITARNVYRYIDLLQDVGFNIVKTGHGRYRLDQTSKRQDYTTFIGFTAEEAMELCMKVASMPLKHPLRQSILNKVHALSDTSEVVADIVYSRQARILNTLNKAISQRNQIRIHDYESANSGDIKDRTVEPMSINLSNGTLTAYEPAIGETRIFKIARMPNVTILRNTFKHTHKHRIARPDTFGMTGEAPVKVRIEMTLRAAALLREEYPLAAEHITKDPQGLRWIYADTVSGHKAIGRFVLGLIGEIHSIQPISLRRHIEKQISVSEEKLST